MPRTNLELVSEVTKKKKPARNSVTGNVFGFNFGQIRVAKLKIAYDFFIISSTGLGYKTNLWEIKDLYSLISDLTLDPSFKVKFTSASYKFCRF